MDEQKVILSDHIEPLLAEAIASCHADRLVVITDETTQRLCWPVVSGFQCLADAQHIVIKPGDENKTLQTVEHVWYQLQQAGATRHSLAVNLGGGMVTDLAGFAASTFKRGMAFINIPTTLLAMVDASVGGKTGFNFGGLKNEIGVFNNANAVILDPIFLRTLDRENLLSGYAEMLKHGLISSLPMLRQLLSFDIEQPHLPLLGQMVGESVAVKQRIVSEDPLEQGLRKALNLGHTVGHAFEALALANQRPVLHGYAVAAGLACELYLCCIKTGFPTDIMRQVVHFITDHYGRMAINCDDYPTLLQLMTHDKKNTAGQINFTLLSDVGQLELNQTATKAEIEEALDFYREGL